MAEDIIVWILVGAVVLWLGLSVRHVFSGKGGGCACGAGGCGQAEACPPAQTDEPERGSALRRTDGGKPRTGRGSPYNT